MGSNSCGQLGVGEAASASNNKYSPILVESFMNIDPYMVKCGFNHSMLQTRDGAVFAWGDNKHGQCGVGIN